jgi:Putative prokaryotic signal transducing protein
MDSDDRRLVTIATFDTPFEASLARGALEAAGIPALVPGEDLGSLTRNRGGVVSAELQVFEQDRDRALAVLDDDRRD